MHPWGLRVPPYYLVFDLNMLEQAYMCFHLVFKVRFNSMEYKCKSWACRKRKRERGGVVGRFWQVNSTWALFRNPVVTREWNSVLGLSSLLGRRKGELRSKDHAVPAWLWVRLPCTPLAQLNTWLGIHLPVYLAHQKDFALFYRFFSFLWRKANTKLLFFKQQTRVSTNGPYSQQMFLEPLWTSCRERCLSAGEGRQRGARLSLPWQGVPQSLRRPSLASSSVCLGGGGSWEGSRTWISKPSRLVWENTFVHITDTSPCFSCGMI